MFYALLGIAALLILAFVGSFRFARWAAGLSDQLARAARPVDISAALPAQVRDFALRADASPDDLAHCVSFVQSAEMQLKPGQPWQPLDATQTVSVGTVGFVWQAQQMLGPVAKINVVDAFVAGQGWLRVRLMGLLRVVNAFGPGFSRAEALRYLAELPCAPDAILGNRHLKWREISHDWVEVSTDVDGAPVAIRFRFDALGDIVEAQADARATTDDQGQPVDYPWQCYFRDYRMIGPRRIPAEGEAGYLRPDGYRAYFQGRITGYEATH